MYVMSVLVSMEGCLTDPPKTPWENSKYPLPYHWEYVVGGFVYVMSVLVSMEDCLADPPKTPWENGKYPLPYHWEYVVGYLCMSCQCWSQWRAASPTLQRHPGKIVSTLYLTIGSMWWEDLCMLCQCWSQWRAASPQVQRALRYRGGGGGHMLVIKI